MIGRLAGIVESLGSGQAIVDVNGVGYLINCSSKTLAVAETGKTVRLEVETQVR
jgi:Holliday junction DNA helicase RuvA